eukprot:tig00020629_g12389.t1
MVGPAAYNASLFSGSEIGVCSFTANTTVGRSSELHRKLLKWGDADFDVASEPAKATGVFLARLRVEQDHNGLEITLRNFALKYPSLAVYIGNPAMPSYERRLYGWFRTIRYTNTRYGTSIRPGTYYILVQGNVDPENIAGPGPISYQPVKGNFPGGPGLVPTASYGNETGPFRLDVFDTVMCPYRDYAPDYWTDDGSCKFAPLGTCSRDLLVSRSYSTQGLQPLLTKAGLSWIGPSSYRDFVMRFERDSALRGRTSLGGGATLFLLRNLTRPTTSITINVCNPTPYFAPTLSFYFGCPGATNSLLVATSAGCSLVVTNEKFYSLMPNNPYYILVEGSLTSASSGNFTLAVSDANCVGPIQYDAYVEAVTTPPSASAPPQQCYPYPYPPPSDYYDIECPPPVTISRLGVARRDGAGAAFCGGVVPDFKNLLVAEWGPTVGLWQSEPPGQGLVPGVFANISNSDWTAANLPTSHSGVHKVAFNVTNTSGRGPHGSCALELRVVDLDGPFFRAGCPPREQELLASLGECSVPAPNLINSFDTSCMRPVSGAATAVQSILPGTPLMLGNTYDARIYSSAFPSGASCPLRFRVRRAAAPRITRGAASPTEIAGIVGGSPALVPVDLSFSLPDACADHASACRLKVRATGDPAAGTSGALATPDGSVIHMWNQTCSGDLKRVLLSPYIRPDSSEGAPGSVARTYLVTLACSYGAELAAAASWSVPVRRPDSV